MRDLSVFVESVNLTSKKCHQGRSTGETLEKLKQECEDIKTLMPLAGDGEDGDLMEQLPSEDTSPLESPMTSPRRVANSNAGLPIEDLDLLPTRERRTLDADDGQ